MPDDKTQRGKADRERISAGQRHEVAHVVKTTGKTPQQVKAAVRQKGPMRDKALGGKS